MSTRRHASAKLFARHTTRVSSAAGAPRSGTRALASEGLRARERAVSSPVPVDPAGRDQRPASDEEQVLRQGRSQTRATSRPSPRRRSLSSRAAGWPRSSPPSRPRRSRIRRPTSRPASGRVAALVRDPPDDCSWRAGKHRERRDVCLQRRARRSRRVLACEARISRW
jgi:hypothetical protein